MVSKSKTKHKTLLFTAAGFSQSYLKYKGKSLSTNFIGETLKDESEFCNLWKSCYKKDPPEDIIKVQKAYSKLYNELDNKQHYNNTFYPLNFETILYLLEFICDMNEPNNEFKSPIDNSFHRSFFLPRQVTQLKNKYSNIYKRDLYHFKNFILDFVNLFEVEENVLKNAKKFFSYMMVKDKRKLNYYTLNYDNLFQKCINENIEPVNYGHDIGTSNIVSSKIFTKYGDHSCFHLHGSINYGISSNTLKYHKDTKKAQKSRNDFISKEISTGNTIPISPIIAGYNKEAFFNNEPYSSFHLKLAFDLKEADKIIILGYGLNDEHINKLLIKKSLPISNSSRGEEVEKNIIDSKYSNANSLIVVDKKDSIEDQKNYITRFFIIMRETGEKDVPSDIESLKITESKENELYEYDFKQFKLIFYFKGVEEFFKSDIWEN